MGRLRAERRRNVMRFNIIEDRSYKHLDMDVIVVPAWAIIVGTVVLSLLAVVITHAMGV
jgi:hypothetical protein